MNVSRRHIKQMAHLTVLVPPSPQRPVTGSVRLLLIGGTRQHQSRVTHPGSHIMGRVRHCLRKAHERLQLSIAEPGRCCTVSARWRPWRSQLRHVVYELHRLHRFRGGRGHLGNALPVHSCAQESFSPACVRLRSDVDIGRCCELG
jgi:hypothetical protein